MAICLYNFSSNLLKTKTILMNNSLPSTPFQNLEVNLSSTERLVSAVSGTLMLYNSLAKKDKNYPRSILSAFLIFRGISGHCPAYKIAGKTVTPEKPAIVNIKVDLSIDKPLYFVYQFWRNLENLPLFMKHLESVTVLDDEISEWKARIPGDLGNLTWKAAITKEVVNREIRWRSFSDAKIHNVGKVEFRENGSFGTNMKVLISYQVPFGKPLETVANVLNPIFENMIEQDVRRFKHYIENK